MTTPLAIATTSAIAAQAGESMARAGGNAVDAAIAATLVSINTMGILFQAQGQFEEAERCFRESLGARRRGQDPERAGASVRT